MSLSDKFAAAAKDVQNLATQPGQAELLELYAYFKQAEVGDVNTCEYSKKYSFCGGKEFKHKYFYLVLCNS